MHCCREVYDLYKGLRQKHDRIMPAIKGQFLQALQCRQYKRLVQASYLILVHGSARPFPPVPDSTDSTG